MIITLRFGGKRIRESWGGISFEWKSRALLTWGTLIMEESPVIRWLRLLPTKEAEHSLRREKGKRYRKSEAAVRYTKLFLPLLHHEIMDLEGSL